MKLTRKIAVLAAYLACSAASASLLPDSYSMLNGGSDLPDTYWDQTYNGSGCVTCNYSSLTGGRGELTDGIIATSSFSVTEPPPGNSPYVGWAIDPTITFHWNTATTINSVTFYLDDSNGYGRVSAPQSVIVNGINFAIPEPAGSAPFAFTASGFSFTGNDLSVTIKRKNSWVFLSEVTFNGTGTAVPEPDTVLLLLIGLGAIAATAGRRETN